MTRTLGPLGAFHSSQLARAGVLSPRHPSVKQCHQSLTLDRQDLGVGALVPQLRRESVDVHLEVLVLCPRSDRTLNYFAHGLDRFTLPDAQAECVIVSGRMDRQGDVRR